MKKLLNYCNEISITAKASLWFLAANVLQKAFMIVFTPIFTRVMTSEEFSKYAVFQSWEIILTVLFTLNISNYATSKALVEYKDNQDDFLISAQCLTVLLSLGGLFVLLFANSVFGFLNEFPTWILFLLITDVLSVALFSFWSQYERFNQRYKALAFVSIISGILAPVISFLLIFNSDNIGLYKGWARIIGLVVTDILLALPMIVHSFKCKRRISTMYWKYCVSYCIPLIPHFLSMAFLQRVGQLFVDYYCGATSAGIFALANSLAMMMMIINDALTKTLVPWTFQKISEEKYSQISRPITLSILMIAILDILLAVMAPEIVRIFANKSYYSAVEAVPSLVSVCYFGFLYNTFANIELYYKETKYVSFASVMAGMIILLCNFILVPRFGFVAAAYSSLISYIIYAFMHYLFMRATLKKHLNGKHVYNNKIIFIISIVFLVIIIAMPFLYRFNIVRFLFLFSCGVLAVIYKNKIIEYISELLKKRG